jgi:hypothetical protein
VYGTPPSQERGGSGEKKAKKKLCTGFYFSWKGAQEIKSRPRWGCCNEIKLKLKRDGNDMNCRYG